MAATIGKNSELLESPDEEVGIGGCTGNCQGLCIACFSVCPVLKVELPRAFESERFPIGNLGRRGLSEAIETSGHCENDGSRNSAHNSSPAARGDTSADVHFWLGVSYYRLGDVDAATRELALAADASSSRSERALYSAKLDWLRSRQPR